MGIVLNNSWPLIIDMKKGLLTLVLATTIAVTSFSYETNQYKFIPKEADVYGFDLDRNKIPDVYWWDKNRDEIIQLEELFIDLNQDGIPDISYKELIEMYEAREIIRKTSA